MHDRERPAPPAPEFEYAGRPSQQAVLANMLSQCIDQVDQLRTHLARAEARIASLSAQPNPSAALAQSEARAEAAEARLAAIKDSWRGVENYLYMMLRREAEACAAFVLTLGTGEVDVPPSVPIFGAGPTGPYLPRPPSHPALALAPRVPQHARQVLLAKSREAGVWLESAADRVQEHAAAQAWPHPPRLGRQLTAAPAHLSVQHHPHVQCRASYPEAPRKQASYQLQRNPVSSFQSIQMTGPALNPLQYSAKPVQYASSPQSGNTQTTDVADVDKLKQTLERREAMGYQYAPSDLGEDNEDDKDAEFKDEDLGLSQISTQNLGRILCTVKDEMPWFRAWYSYDGNFQSYRKQKKVDAGDVCFSDGLAYFPPNETYDNWISSQPEPKKSEEKPKCDNHKAGRDNSVKAANRDITGVGAFTCTSHSCVAPRGMVNFRRGERQIYCDMAFAAMYKHCSARGWLPIGMTYDVWCHWWVNFFRRAANLPPEYEIPEDLDLVGAVGKWHLLGHIQECWIRWSLDYLQHVGRLEGKGPERVWAHFNEHSGSTSEQGPGQRIDSMNNIAYGWNFCKGIEMHICLPTRYCDALKSRGRELTNHERLSASLPRKTILDWELEPIVAEYKDGKWSSPFMDPTVTGGFQETIQEERENENIEVRGSGKRNGAVWWLVEGIEIEHNVQNLKDEEKKLGSKLTPGQANGVTSKRIKLRDRIDAFLEKRPLYLLDIGDPDRPRPIDFVGEDGDWAQPVDLGLPSSYLYATLIDAGLSKMADLEAKLRRGVCRDALESVKRQLRGKAAAIKHKNSSSEISGTMAVTRAESAIQTQTAKILKTRWRYLNSREALLQIKPTEADLLEYLDLKIEDLKPLGLYYKLYGQTTGHGTTSMSWIWRSAVARNEDEAEIEALKPEWFRSRERFKRWDEQLVLTKREMIMTIRSFQSHQEIWEWKSRNGQATPGMRAYACRRSRFFANLSRQMLEACLEHLKDDTVRLPWAEKWLAANTSGRQF
ncbi:hypothetical protein FRC12_023010 [Ceratobasidium sp. 428]|nr:hypothetical protein FRC12_023010 [Ceratobasidium sp. 428]